MERSSDGHPVFEADHQLVEDQGPIVNVHGPFFEDLAMRQEEQLASCLGSGKGAFGFGDLTQLAMITLLANLHARKQKLPVQQTAWYPEKLPTFSDALSIVKETLFMQHYFPTSLFPTNIRKPQLTHLVDYFPPPFTPFQAYRLDKV